MPEESGVGDNWAGFIQGIVSDAAKGYITHEWSNNQPYMLDQATGRPYIPGQPVGGIQSVLSAPNGGTGMIVIGVVVLGALFLLVK